MPRIAESKPTTGFFQRVYALVAAVPKGKVMTYGQIAEWLGGYHSGRTVGFAMRAAPSERNLPCHRVVNKRGEMSPGHVFGGAERQRGMLKKEGVPFLPDGRIDMGKALARRDEMGAEKPEKRRPPPGKKTTRAT